MSAKGQPEWNWSSDGEWTIRAQYFENDPKEGEVVKVQVLDANQHPHSQPLYVYLDDGPEWLASLAEFVDSIRRQCSN